MAERTTDNRIGVTARSQAGVFINWLNPDGPGRFKRDEIREPTEAERAELVELMTRWAERLKL